MLRETVKEEYGEEWAKKLEETQEKWRGNDQNVIESKVNKVDDKVVALYELAKTKNEYKLIRYIQLTPPDNSTSEEGWDASIDAYAEDIGNFLAELLTSSRLGSFSLNGSYHGTTEEKLEKMIKELFQQLK